MNSDIIYINKVLHSEIELYEKDTKLHIGDRLIYNNKLYVVIELSGNVSYIKPTDIEANNYLVKSSSFIKTKGVGLYRVTTNYQKEAVKQKIYTEYNTSQLRIGDLLFVDRFAYIVISSNIMSSKVISSFDLIKGDKRFYIGNVVLEQVSDSENKLEDLQLKVCNYVYNDIRSEVIGQSYLDLDKGYSLTCYDTIADNLSTDMNLSDIVLDTLSVGDKRLYKGKLLIATVTPEKAANTYVLNEDTQIKGCHVNQGDTFLIKKDNMTLQFICHTRTKDDINSSFIFTGYDLLTQDKTNNIRVCDNALLFNLIREDINLF